MYMSQRKFNLNLYKYLHNIGINVCRHGSDPKQIEFGFENYCVICDKVVSPKNKHKKRGD